MRLIKLGLVSIICLFTAFWPAIVSAARSDELRSIYREATFYDPNSDSCSLNGISNQNPGSTTLTPGAKIFYIGDSLTYGMTKIGDLLGKTAEDGGFSVDRGYTIDNKPAPGLLARTQGPSVDATGGITIGGTSDWIESDATGIAAAGGIVIGLGTNGRAETKQGRSASDTATAVAQTTAIATLIRKIRAINKTAPIYWINTYFTDTSYGNYLTINKTIGENAASNGYTVIDLAGAVASKTLIAPDGGDGVHFGPSGYAKRSDFIVSKLKSLATGTAPTPGLTGSASYDPISLRYPNFPNESLIIQNLKTHISKVYPRSPFAKNLQYVDTIFSTSKRSDRNINPFLVIAIAQQENGYGQGNSSAISNNNYFGITQGNGYRKFNSVEESIDYFIERISAHVTKPAGAYTGVSNFYEYISVHNVGLIAYPGEYPEGAPGRNANPPYLTYDPRMDVYTSWEDIPGQIKYNPGIYFLNSINLINKITGLSLTTTPARGASSLQSGGCSSLAAQNTAAKYITDCNANGGNAAIACTAINQLMAIPYDVGAKIKDPAPKFLDCSALTGQALYRTFGTDMSGNCSVMYLNNKNFEVIDVHDIQPGDMVGMGSVCNSAPNGDGHIAVVVSYDRTNKKLLTMESSSKKWPSGIRGIPGSYNVGLKADGNGNYEWAVRYIGPKTLQPGAL